MFEKSSVKLLLRCRQTEKSLLPAIFESSAHLVFEAWTKSEHVRQWWGCAAPR